MVGAIVLTLDDDYKLLNEKRDKKKNDIFHFFSSNIN